jgi:hypothetical protein
MHGLAVEPFEQGCGTRARKFDKKSFDGSRARREAGSGGDSEGDSVAKGIGLGAGKGENDVSAVFKIGEKLDGITGEVTTGV